MVSFLLAVLFSMFHFGSVRFGIVLLFALFSFLLNDKCIDFIENLLATKKQPGHQAEPAEE